MQQTPKSRVRSAALHFLLQNTPSLTVLSTLHYLSNEAKEKYAQSEILSSLRRLSQRPTAKELEQRNILPGEPIHLLLSPSFTSPFSCVFTRISFVGAVMLRSPLSISSSLKSIERISHSLICKMFFPFASGTTGVTKRTAVWTLLGLRALHYKFVCDLNKYTSAR